ncbi:MAG: hypothetical protein AAB198_05970 [Actinomycetota bacterium]
MTEDNVELFISELRSEADAAHFAHVTEPAIARASRPSLMDRLRARAVAVAAGVVLTVGGFGGAAYAANGAAPGDTFYGLDRALEAVGIGNGGSAERLAEVKELVDHGQTAGGLEHAADIVEGDVGAQAALLAAAERIGALDEVEAHEGVAALLTYLSESVGSVDGPTVAELARAINGQHGEDGEEGEDGDDGDDDDAEDGEGPPEGVTPGGPPDGSGPPDHGGPPVTTP